MPKTYSFCTFFLQFCSNFRGPPKKRSHKVLFRFTFSPPTYRRTELAAAAAAASSCRVRHGADLCYGITAETQTIGKGILPCQGSLIGNDGPFNGTLHDGESQESGHLLTLTRVVGVAVAWCARTSFKRFRGLARKYLRFCVI